MHFVYALKDERQLVASHTDIVEQHPVHDSMVEVLARLRNPNKMSIIEKVILQTERLAIYFLKDRQDAV